MTLLGIGVVFLVVPSFGLFREQLDAVGIGTGFLDLVGLGVLLAIAAGCARSIGLIGERVIARG